MVHFLIYLFETGLCLSLLYLAYWLFLRKETYFNFNRFFLVGSILLALLLPFLHLNFAIEEEGKLSETASGILKFRHSYEEIIGMLDADFGEEPGKMHNGVLASKPKGMPDEIGILPSANMYETSSDEVLKSKDKLRQFLQKFNFSQVILIIYICGVMYFLVRFIYLVIRLSSLAKHNGFSRQDGFRIVEIKEDISPFSFFRFLFINSDSFSESEFQNVLEHEKAHIMQRHSFDHLFVHGLAVFQWFNPFAWQMRKALKTTHEYIADRQVIDKGFEMFDYQSLLLRQVIGYHSVELVNNFNLKPIKNRIAMMTKNKSGFNAKLKATLVIPIAIITFLLFADFSLKGSEINENAYDLELKDDPVIKQLSGLWIKKTPGEWPERLMINEESFSILRETEVSNYSWNVGKDRIHLTAPKTGNMQFKLQDKELILKWNAYDEVIYYRSEEQNALDEVLSHLPVKIKLPVLTQYRILENENLICRITIGKDSNGAVKYYLDGKETGISFIGQALSEKRMKINNLDANEFITVLQISKEIKMSVVDKLKNELRKVAIFRYADAGYPYGDNHSISALIFDKVALPRLLPPPDAKMLDIDQLKTEGRPLMIINLAKRNTNPATLEKDIHKYIGENKGKYLFSLQYDKDIPYGQYIETSDMIFNVVYKFREDLATEKYGVSYGELGDALQKDIRKDYPVSISEMMVEE